MSRREDLSEMAEAIADAGDKISKSLHRLGNGNAATEMGGLEALGCAVIEAFEKLSESIIELATCTRESGEDIRTGLEDVADAIRCSQD